MNVYTSSFFIALLFLSATWPGKPNKETPDVSYRVESINIPTGLNAETGALAFLPDGRLVASFLRGEVMFYDPKSKKWSLFAEGLHDPLGLLAISNSELLVMQRPELTRIKDTDGDGQADLYETVTDAFGVTGNYHEFNYGPVTDTEGNLYFALNSSSAGGGVRPEIRGRLDTSGRSAGKEMFSVVPYRGWIMKLKTDGTLQPYAMGLRSPNGLGFDLQGNLFATDNQGDWVGTSTLYHIQQGNFYGHPASLIWKKGWDKGNPFNLPVQQLNNMKTRAAVLFPQDIIANSPTQPLCDGTEGKFGPFAGQLFVGEMNSERIVRVMLEEVGGQLQGACIPFLDGQGLRRGNNRLAFATDGSLWVGQAAHGWGGDNGVQRIVFTGKQPMDVHHMALTTNGFDLTFTQPLDSISALNPANYKVQSYFYEYHKKYGSEQMDSNPVSVTKIKRSPDHKKISFVLDKIEPGYIYQLNLGNIKAQSGDTLVNRVICYTVNKLKTPGLVTNE